MTIQFDWQTLEFKFKILNKHKLVNNVSSKEYSSYWCVAIKLHKKKKILLLTRNLLGKGAWTVRAVQVSVAYLYQGLKQYLEYLQN